MANHLAECSECSREVAGLRAASELLSLAPPTTADSPGDLLLRRTLTRAAGERRRRRVLIAASAVAVAVVSAPIGAWVLASVGDDPPPTQVTVVQAAASDPHSGVDGTARLGPLAGGSEVTVRVSGVAPGTTCNLVVTDRDGRRSVIDTWTASYAGGASVTAQSDVAVGDIDDVDLTDADTGDLLLRFDLA